MKSLINSRLKIIIRENILVPITIATVTPQVPYCLQGQSISLSQEWCGLGGCIKPSSKECLWAEAVLWQVLASFFFKSFLTCMFPPAALSLVLQWGLPAAPSSWPPGTNQTVVSYTYVCDKNNIFSIRNIVSCLQSTVCVLRFCICIT